jgi:hypothetical protein
MARGGFVVSSAMRDGEVEFVEIDSRRGEVCRMRNPWGTNCTLTKVDGPTREMDGEILRFDTAADSRYRLTPAGSPTAAPVRISPQSAASPVTYQVTLPSGTTVQGVLGRGR